MPFVSVILPMSLLFDTAVWIVLGAITISLPILHGTNVVGTITPNLSSIEYVAIVAPVAFPNSTTNAFESAISFSLSILIHLSVVTPRTR